MTPFYLSNHGALFNMDCIKVMKKMADQQVDTIFADPPFNLGKDYKNGFSDNKSTNLYYEWCEEWIFECKRILKPGGALFIYATPEILIQLARFIEGEDMLFRHWIAVTMKGSFPIRNKLYPAHYGILYYTKGKPRVFNRIRTPIELCRHCHGEVKDYGGHRSKMHPDGVSLMDLWVDTSPNRHNKYKVRPGVNELKLVIPKRCIEISTNTGDIVFDPFGGGGGTFQAAQELNRKWLGAEMYDYRCVKERMLNTPSQSDTPFDWERFISKDEL
jgi:site-specific DNA-methyltransferase (adenine-specific)